MNIKNLFKVLIGLFRAKPDPLDEMLRDKGVDPEKLLDDLYYKREAEGDSNTINRVKNRVEERRRKAPKVIRRPSGGFNF